MPDTSGAAPAGAVTYNRPAIDQATGGSPSPKPIGTAAQNAITALRLGWALEELIARTRLEPPAGYKELKGPAFPPDLTHQLGPNEQLKLLWKLLQLEEKTLLTALTQMMDEPAPATDPPSTTLRLGDKIAALLTATKPSPEFDASVKDMDQAVLDWNEAIVAKLLDPVTSNASSPANAAILSSYEVGKALSRTHWYIWMSTVGQKESAPPSQTVGASPSQSVSASPSQSVGAPSSQSGSAANHTDAWNDMFRGNRIGNIRRHLDGLANTLDPKTVTTVSTNLEYWHNALHNLDGILDVSNEHSSGSPGRFGVRHDDPKTRQRGSVAAWPRGMSSRDQKDIHVRAAETPRLLVALEEQMDNWYDLLTGRRRPEDFPITGIITDLLDELGTEAQAALPGILRRVVAPLVVPGAIVVFVVIAVIVVLGLLTLGGNASPLAGGLAGLSAGLAALVALVMGRGASLAGQASTDIGALEERMNQLEADARQRMTAVTQSLPGPARDMARRADQGLAHFSWQALLQNALSDVEQQIKIEELNLAISEPLVRYVLAPQSTELAADPKAAAKRFLELIYSGTSNVERLENVFSNLYRQTFTSGPISGPGAASHG